LVLIAKDFTDADIDKAKKSKGEITLIRYIWFEDGLLLIHYLNNEPLEVLIEKRSRERSVKILPEVKRNAEKHLDGAANEMDFFFKELDTKICNLSPHIVRYTNERVINYKTSVKFLEIKIQKHELRLLLRTNNSKINDPKHLTEIVPKTHGWGRLTHIAYLDPHELNKKFSFDDVIDIVVQSFKTTQ